MPRTALERLFLSQALYCAECRRKTRLVHHRAQQALTRVTWLFSTHSSCSRCGSTSVRRVPRYRSSSRRPSILLRLVQSIQLPGYRCLRCDQSYADIHPVRVVAPEAAASVTGRTVRRRDVAVPSAVVPVATPSSAAVPEVSGGAARANRDTPLARQSSADPVEALTMPWELEPTQTSTPRVMH